MSMKDIVDAARTYAKEVRRAWHETPGRSTKSLRKLEGTHKK
jgi:hypothetical protein